LAGAQTLSSRLGVAREGIAVLATMKELGGGSSEKYTREMAAFVGVGASSSRAEIGLVVRGSEGSEDDSIAESAQRAGLPRSIIHRF